MAEPRNIHIKLTADNSEALKAIAEVKAALVDLKSAGIEDKDLSATRTNVIKLSGTPTLVANVKQYIEGMEHGRRAI